LKITTTCTTGISPISTNSTRIDEHRGQLESLDNTVNDHEHRIESLEQELKHIKSMIQDISAEYFKVVSDEDTAEESADEGYDRIEATVFDETEHIQKLTFLRDQLVKWQRNVPKPLADFFMSHKMNEVPTGILVDFINYFISDRTFSLKKWRTKKELYISSGKRALRMINAFHEVYHVDCQNKPESIPGFGSPGKCSLGRFSLYWLVELISSSYDFFEAGSPDTRLHNGEAIVLLREKEMTGIRVLTLRSQNPYPIIRVNWHDIIDTTTQDGPITVYSTIPIYDIMHSVVVLLANELEVLSDDDVNEIAACSGILSGSIYGLTSHLTHEYGDVNPFNFAFEDAVTNTSRGYTCTMCQPCLHSPKCLKQCNSGCGVCIRDKHAKSGNSFTERMRSKFIELLGVEDAKNKLTFWYCLEYLFPGVEFKRTATLGGTLVSINFENIDYMEMYGFDPKNVEFFEDQEDKIADEEDMGETGGQDEEVSFEFDLNEMQEDEEKNNKEATNHKCNDDDSSSGVEFRPHVGMKILSLLYRGGEELYYGTIVELLLMKEHEYVRVRWADYRGKGVTDRNGLILCKLIHITWDKRAKAGDLGSDNETKLPKNRNKWFDGW
jgi:hypothetical protein